MDKNKNSMLSEYIAFFKDEMKILLIKFKNRNMDTNSVSGIRAIVHYHKKHIYCLFAALIDNKKEITVTQNDYKNICTFVQDRLNFLMGQKFVRTIFFIKASETCPVGTYIDFYKKYVYRLHFVEIPKIYKLDEECMTKNICDIYNISYT